MGFAHPEQFPVDINKADYEMLLRVPGVGVKVGETDCCFPSFFAAGILWTEEDRSGDEESAIFHHLQRTASPDADSERTFSATGAQLLLPKPKKKVDERQLLLDFGE